MIRNVFHKLIFGDPDKRDYSERDIPKTRRQLFKEVIKARWSSMIWTNLLYVIIWLPAFAWSVVNFAMLYSHAAADALTQRKLDSIIYTYFLFLLPLIAITGPSSMGISFVMRNWARDEHAFTFADYMEGAKKNWKYGLIFSTISGTILSMIGFCGRFYSSIAAGFPLFWLPMALILAIGMLWNLSSMLMPMLIVTYDIRFKDVIKNAFLMTVSRLFLAIGIRLLTMLIPAAALLIVVVFPGSMVTVGTFLLMLYILFIPSFNKLIIASYANALCEHFMNERMKGTRVDIGLRSERDGGVCA